MKNELKISTVSMICVLCASGMSGAYGASSVRTLGGTGTYTSAASASQSGGGAGVARAGSVRVTPTATKTTTTTSNSASVTAGRAATTPRLSLGKYLGGGTAISGGSSTRPGNGTSGGGATTTNPGLSADVANRLEVLEDTVADLKSSGEDLKETKQDKLTGDDYIEIDKDGNVSLIVENLKEDLQGINGRDVVIGVSDDGKYIVWQNDGDSEWTKLIAIEELVGPQGEKGEKGDKGDPGDAADMALYSTTEQMNLAIADALKGYVATGDVYSKAEIDEKLTPVTSFEERMADLTKTVEDNMQELRTELITVNETVNNITNEEGNLIIAPNSITAREIAPNSITNTELADKAVKLENLNSDVSEQLVGAPKDEKDGMYVLLVTPDGERVWADLAMGADETGAD